MNTLTLDKLVHFYAPFARIDPDERVVEGYCYTSPRVKGDKWNLKRAALEKAASRYMEMPAVRSMHQPIAAGKGLGITWDDKGCLLRAKIVDDNEWNKVREGVYRGFSLGGRPLVARGNDIEDFEWVETSLVDRPCDPGALFTVVRAVETDGEYSVCILDDEDEGTEAGEVGTDGGGLARNDDAADHTDSADYTDARGDEDSAGAWVWENDDFETAGAGNVAGADDVAPVAESVDAHHEDAVTGNEKGSLNEPNTARGGAAAGGGVETPGSESSGIEGGTPFTFSRSELYKNGQVDSGLDHNTVQRWKQIEQEHGHMVARAEAAESALSVVRADLETTRADLESVRAGLSDAEEEVKRLRALPRERKPFVQYAAGVPRHFAVNDLLPPDKAVKRGDLEQEREKLLAEAQSESDALKRVDTVKRILALEHRLAHL